MWDIGTKLKCVDGNFPQGITEYYNALPIEGNVYTMRDIAPATNLYSGKEGVAIYVDELVNLPNKHGIEPGFLTQRFREVEETKEEESSEAFTQLTEEEN